MAVSWQCHDMSWLVRLLSVRRAVGSGRRLGLGLSLGRRLRRLHLCIIQHQLLSDPPRDSAPRSGCRAPGCSRAGGSSSCTRTLARSTGQRAARAAVRHRSAARGEAARTPLGASPGHGRRRRLAAGQHPGPARDRGGADAPCPHAAAWTVRRRRRQPSCACPACSPARLLLLLCCASASS